MDWYKLAKKEMEYSAEGIIPWLNEQIDNLKEQNIEPFTFLRKYNISLDEIEDAYNATKFPLTTLENAIALTKQFQNQQKLNKADKAKQKTTQFEQKYLGKSCTLNGYPATITSHYIGSDYPTIINDQGQHIQRSWFSVAKNFPNFVGGGVYVAKNTAEDVKTLIRIEETKASYPGQSAVLGILRSRLHSLMEYEGKFNPNTQRFTPFTEEKEKITF